MIEFAVSRDRKSKSESKSNDSDSDGFAAAARVSLESVLCTEELSRRPSRPPDCERENEALLALANALAASPRTVLQTLAETILRVCQCGSAGVSLLTSEDGGKRFYWPAIAGEWKTNVGGGTPRNFGPCGDVLDRGTPLLFHHLDRRYTYFKAVAPLVEEILLVPFYVQGKAVGTIWAVTHDDHRKFDAEDQRLMTSLGTFASSAYQFLVSFDALNVAMAAREKAEGALRVSNTKLEDLVAQRTDALRLLTVRLLQSQDEERRRFARNLHDSIGQHLAALKMNLDSMTGAEPQLVRPQLISESLHAVTECLKEIRTISYLLHPPLLEEAGFESAARWYVEGFAQRGGIQAKLHFAENMARLPESVELALFRVLQESLTNVHRHSGSPTVDIDVKVGADRVVMAVKDAGRGIPKQVLERFLLTGTAGIGLAGMRERLADLGGELRVQSNKKGTLLMASIPIRWDASKSAQQGWVA